MWCLTLHGSSWDSAVSMATRGSNPSRGKIFFFFFFKYVQSSSGAQPFWGPTSFLFNGYCSSLRRVQRSRVMNLTTHLNLVLRLRMSKVTLLLPHYAFMSSLVEENMCDNKDELTGRKRKFTNWTSLQLVTFKKYC